MVDRIRWDTVSYLPFYYIFIDFQFLLLTIFNLQAKILAIKDILSKLVVIGPNKHNVLWMARRGRHDPAAQTPGTHSPSQWPIQMRCHNHNTETSLVLCQGACYFVSTPLNIAVWTPFQSTKAGLEKILLSGSIRSQVLEILMSKMATRWYLPSRKFFFNL